MAKTSSLLFKAFYWKALSAIINIFNGILIARLLQASNVGNFYSYIYFVSFIITFLTFGFDISLNYFLTKKIISTTQAISIIVAICLFAIVGSLFFFAFFPIHTLYTSLLGSYAVAKTVVLICSNLLITFSTVLLTVKNKNHFSGIVLLVLNGLQCMGLLYLLLATNSLQVKQLVVDIYFCIVFLTALFTSVFALRCSNISAKWQMPSKAVIVQMLHYSFFTFIINWVFYLASRCLLFYIPASANKVEMGNVMQAFKLIEYISMAISFVYFPFITILIQHQNPQKLLLQMLRLSNMLVGGIIVLLVLFGNYFFPLLFGNSFQSMYNYLLLLLPALLAISSSAFITAYFFSVRKLRYNFISAIVQLLFTIMVFGIGINYFSYPICVVLSISTGTFLSYIVDIFLLKKIMSFTISKIWLINKEDIHALQRLSKDGIESFSK